MRTYTPKGTHTSPEKAGDKNIAPILDTVPKDVEGINAQVYPCWEHGRKMQNIYKGQWTDEQVSNEIADFFLYCTVNKVKPTKPLLRMWLDISRSQIWEWETKKEKYGEKSNILERAYNYMESYLQGNIDKYPTGSIFLLKTSHGHIESNRLDVVTNGNDINSAEDVKDLVTKLGLDKK